MNNEELYKSVKKYNGTYVRTDYYIIPENISADYCDLKCYGIKIEKTFFFAGGAKTAESRKISNVFYKRTDAEKFLDSAAKFCIAPARLDEYVEKYIAEGIDRAKKSA